MRLWIVRDEDGFERMCCGMETGLENSPVAVGALSFSVSSETISELNKSLSLALISMKSPSVIFGFVAQASTMVCMTIQELG
jgi:hypothetical protein